MCPRGPRNVLTHYSLTVYGFSRVPVPSRMRKTSKHEQAVLNAWNELLKLVEGGKDVLFGAYARALVRPRGRRYEPVSPLLRPHSIIRDGDAKIKYSM